MSVREALDKALETLPASELEAEIARSLADALGAKDNGQGKASTAKELRSMLAELQERQGTVEVDEMDELARKRDARRNAG